MASTSWKALIGAIREAFSSGNVDKDKLKKLMEAYESRQEDWEKYAKFDPHHYTRNLVEKGNGKYNLIVLCWQGGQSSEIHNHEGSQCFMKVLSGTLKETLYKWPDESAGEKEMQQTESTSFCTDQVTYIDDSVGLHCVENSTKNQAVSLHLYCPPITHPKKFEKKTGQSQTCELTFHSIDGKVLPRTD